MKLIVGLGNPGQKYQNNRHNAGFMVVEELVRKKKLGEWQSKRKFESQIVEDKDLLIIKPQTFMNESGRAVLAVKNFYKIDTRDIYVVHDDLDIVLGNYKIQQGKGPQVHNGLRSIERELATDQFWNARVGVENREIRGNKGVPGVVYSLKDFETQEREIVGDVIDKVVADLLTRLG